MATIKPKPKPVKGLSAKQLNYYGRVYWLPLQAELLTPDIYPTFQCKRRA